MTNVLVIDDQKDVADSLAAVLRLYGCAVTVAYSGPDGLDAAARRPPDVVLLDLGMPRMDGFEVAKRLREQWGHQVRLIAHSAWSDSAMKRHASEAGFDRFLVKPVEPSELGELVQEPRRQK